MHRRSMLGGTVAVAATATMVQRRAQAQSQDFVVFAAASLRNVLDDVGERFRRDTAGA